MPTVLITGANRGIGLALTQLLRQRGDEVIAVCRRSSTALEQTGARVEPGVDVTDAEAVEALAKKLRAVKIDWLILNAGILSGQHLGRLDWQSMRQQFEVNALGPLRVAEALLDNLGDGAKIGIITSRMGSIADNSSGGNYGYRMSKVAVNMAGKSLAEDLRPRNIAVFLLHPGFVRTEMVKGAGYVEAPESAANLIQRLDELGMAQSGSFWHAQGEPLPW